MRRVVQTRGQLGTRIALSGGSGTASGSSLRARRGRAPRCGPPPAGAHHPAAALAAAPAICAGAADASLQPHRVITGEFDTSLERAYVMLPFVVPAGTTAVRVRYCHDQPEAPTNAQIKHVLDLGLWEARPALGAPWAEPEFRGWGGSSHPDVTVSPQWLLERGAVPREPQAPPPGTHDTRLPSRPAPGRRMGGRAGCRGGRVAARGRLRRPGRMAGRDRPLDRSAVGGGPICARAL